MEIPSTSFKPMGYDDDEYDNLYGAITQHMPLQGRLDKDHDACHVRDIRPLEIM